MRPLHYSILLAAVLAAGGCASPQKKQAKLEQQLKAENSRVTEERRMRAFNNNEIGSQRGAEVLVWDPEKKFDPSRSNVGAVRPYGTGGARVKDFNYQNKTRIDAYDAREFAGTKKHAASQREYATKEMNSTTGRLIPNVDREAGNKTAGVKDAWESGRTEKTRSLHDGQRQYLGPESKKLNTAVDPKTMADWRNAGNETIFYGNGAVERMSTLKQLSIEDVRELLNKNK